MGIAIRQSFKGTLISYIGAALGAITVIFIYPLCLPPNLIGLLRVLIDSAFFLSFFAQLGIPGAVIKYFPMFDNQKGKFFTSMLILVTLGFIFFSSILLLFKDRYILYFSKNSPEYIKFFFYIFPLAFFLTLTSTTESFSTVLHRIVVPRFYKEIMLRVVSIIIIFLFYLHIFKVQGFLSAILLAYGLVFVFVLIYFNHISPTKFNLPRISYFRTPVFKEIFSFMMFILVAGLGVNIISKIDVFMITSKLGLNNTGVYTIAFFISSFIEIPARSISQIMSPFISKAFSENNIEQIKEYYQKITLNQLIIGGTFFLLIWINLDNIYAIMPKGEYYSSGKYVVLFIGLAKLVDVVTGINSYIVGYSKFFKILPITVVLLGGLTIYTNNLLIPVFGITGAAIATLISITIYNFAIIVIIKFKLKIQPFKQNNLIVIMILLIAFFISYFMPNISNLYLDSIVKSTVVLSFVLFFVYLLKISNEVNNTIKNILLLVHKFLKI